MAKGFSELARKKKNRLGHLVTANVKIFEQTQVEAQFSYWLTAKAKDDKPLIPKVYELDAYFVFAPRMRVMKETYSIEQFYRDLKNFIRLREPRLSYKELLGTTEDTKNSPVLLISQYIAGIVAGTIARPPDAYIEEARIFGCSFYSYLHRRSERLCRQLKDCNQEDSLSREDVTIRFAKFIDRGSAILKVWRELDFKLSQNSTEHLGELALEVRRVNEYCTYVYREAMLQMMANLGLEMGNDQQLKVLHHRIRVALRFERWYAKKSGFFWLTDNSKLELRERFVYRRGLLKRRLWSSLFLNTRTKPLFSFQRHIASMAAAAVAGVWAIAVEIFIRLNAGLVPGDWSKFLGFSGFLLISAFTMAYVLKDRIKEVGRGYFRGGIFKNIPDQSNKIVYRTETEDLHTINIGTVQESAHYVELEKLPKDITELLKKYDEELREDTTGRKNIIQYRKVFILDRPSLSLHSRRLAVLRDIMRLNVNAFLTALDSPYQELLSLSDQGRVRRILSPKIYTIDLILKMKVVVPENGKIPSHYGYYRLILNKRGIKRIDLIL